MGKVSGFPTAMTRLDDAVAKGRACVFALCKVNFTVEGGCDLLRAFEVCAEVVGKLLGF